LGAYFNNIPGVPIGIGSYESVSGTVDAPGPAEQTLLGVVQVIAPAGPYTVWAERVADTFAEQPSRNRLLYVLNEQQLVASEKLIGEPPGYLAVLTDRPSDSGTIANAFADSRYVWKKTEAVYLQSDPNRVPRMVFLHWAELRPMTDWKGRSETERGVATRLGGTLVFPIAVPVGPSDRERPQVTFAEALEAQFPGGGSLSPRVVTGPESSSDVRAVDQRAAQSALLTLAILGCGAVAAWAGYKATRSMRGQPA
jgi:hypothetical protein